MTSFSDGSYLVSYTVGSGSDTDIAARIVSPTGVPGAEFSIFNDPYLADNSELATLSNGNFVAVFQDPFLGSATDIDVKFGIFSHSGAAVLPVTTVAGAGGLETENDPSVAALHNGGFVVVWTDGAIDGSGQGIGATIYDNAGGVVQSNIHVNTTTLGNQNEAHVTGLSDGGFMVTWEDDNANLVRAQRFDALGHQVGTEFVTHNGVATDSPDLALLQDGRVAFAIGDDSTGDADVTTSIWDPRTPFNNFDGVHQSDFLWQNDNGQAAVWLLNGTDVATPAIAGYNPGPTWHVHGSGDFNADGRSDILWQDDSGQAAIWKMNGTTLVSAELAGYNPGPTWHVKDAGDFNADDHSDILWQDDSGQAAIWQMNGSTVVDAEIVGSNPGPTWHVVSSGDFNGDGKSDILWQNDSGQAAIWLMNGATVLDAEYAGYNPGPTWHVKDAGDFNGDGKSDILWQNDDGQAAVWFMNGTSLTSAETAGYNPGPTWHVKGAGEFNGDNHADIVWQSDAGQGAVWEMNGSTVVTPLTVGYNPGADWHLIA